MAGKGSKPRPYSVKYTTFSDRWDVAFGKKKSPSKAKKVKLDNEPPREAAKPKTKGKLSLCPHCATMNLKKVNSWTRKCLKCGWND